MSTTAGATACNGGEDDVVWYGYGFNNSPECSHKRAPIALDIRHSHSAG